MTELDFKLPKELEKYRDIITSTIKPCVKITAKKQKTLLWESKFAGFPYITKGAEYPVDKLGKPMKLLAQINFEEVPAIDLFPTQGILQFFISIEDDVYGLNFDDVTCQDNFRVIYRPKIIKDDTKLMTDFSFLNQFDDECFPILNEGLMHFEKRLEPVSPDDYQFDKYFNKSSFNFFDSFGEDEEKVSNFYYENFSAEGHKIGGYAYFTQNDPREYSYKDYDILLFQIDTDDTLNIMWGDCGVANFFIKKTDLINLNFDNVLYNWDCC